MARTLANHNKETLKSHYELLRLWLDSFFEPDCLAGNVVCESCPFNVKFNDDRTLCAVLEDIRKLIK